MGKMGAEDCLWLVLYEPALAENTVTLSEWDHWEI